MNRALKYLLEKEFKQITRDKFLPKMILFLPLMQLLILPLAANFEMRNINICVVDHDQSSYSRQLRDKVVASGYFVLAGTTASYNEALKLVESDCADVILQIPHRFEQQLIGEGQAPVLIVANTVNGVKGSMGSSYLSAIITDFNGDIRQEWLPPVQTATAGMPDMVVQYLYNPHLNYKMFMVPGIMVMLLTIIGGFLSALNIVSEKEKGTIEQINVTPVPKSVFIISKLIPFWLIGFVVLTIGVLVAWIVYGITPVGNLGIIYLFAGVYLIAFTGLGLVISNYSNTIQQAMFTSLFFLMIFILMSGLFTPITSMPKWAQTITYINPLRYFIEVMRMIYLKGSHLADVLPQLGVICLFAIAFNFWAVRSYKKNS